VVTISRDHGECWRVEGSRMVHSSEIDPYSMLDRHDPELDLLPFMGVNAAEV
jgi:hypothetical protein